MIMSYITTINSYYLVAVPLNVLLISFRLIGPLFKYQCSQVPIQLSILSIKLQGCNYIGMPLLGSRQKGVKECSGHSRNIFCKLKNLNFFTVFPQTQGISKILMRALHISIVHQNSQCLMDWYLTLSFLYLINVSKYNFH